MHVPSRRILQDTVTAIRLRRAISELGLEGSVMLSAIFGVANNWPSCTLLRCWLPRRKLLIAVSFRWMSCVMSILRTGTA